MFWACRVHREVYEGMQSCIKIMIYLGKGAKG